MEYTVEKKFRKLPHEIHPVAVGFGSCIASDRITVDGMPVGYMFRRVPINEFDSGWIFFAGDESEDYAAESKNFEIYDVNTIANYDPSITEHLEMQPPCELERDESGHRFVETSTPRDEM